MCTTTPLLPLADQAELRPGVARAHCGRRSLRPNRPHPRDAPQSMLDCGSGARSGEGISEDDNWRGSGTRRSASGDYPNEQENQQPEIGRRDNTERKEGPAGAARRGGDKRIEMEGVGYDTEEVKSLVGRREAGNVALSPRRAGIGVMGRPGVVAEQESTGIGRKRVGLGDVGLTGADQRTSGRADQIMDRSRMNWGAIFAAPSGQFRLSVTKMIKTEGGADVVLCCEDVFGEQFYFFMRAGGVGGRCRKFAVTILSPRKKNCTAAVPPQNIYEYAQAGGDQKDNDLWATEASRENVGLPGKPKTCKPERAAAASVAVSRVEGWESVIADKIFL
ncbi:hypothetical protein C8F04DRAFT_1201340 [Mycena alexandri]|uniref:Uncharacterized protein n=1 Tax=Mycena alexandri TaxID=1745969 RepID=A0AAD6WMN6_9AGAR|nr:hypothetical protein C8F04DRAFT_1201340 [Mycena alexandri]